MSAFLSAEAGAGDARERSSSRMPTSAPRAQARSTQELRLPLRAVQEQCALVAQGLHQEQVALEQRAQALLAGVRQLEQALRDDSPCTSAELNAFEQAVTDLQLAETRTRRWQQRARWNLPLSLSVPLLAAGGLVAWAGAMAGLESLGDAAWCVALGVGASSLFQVLARLRCGQCTLAVDSQRIAALRLLAAARVLPETSQPDAASLRRSAARWREKLRRGAASATLSSLRAHITRLPSLDDHLLPLRALCAFTSADA